MGFSVPAAILINWDDHNFRHWTLLSQLDSFRYSFYMAQRGWWQHWSHCCRLSTETAQVSWTHQQWDIWLAPIGSVPTVRKCLEHAARQVAAFSARCVIFYGCCPHRWPYKWGPKVVQCVVSLCYLLPQGISKPTNAWHPAGQLSQAHTTTFLFSPNL